MNNIEEIQKNDNDTYNYEEDFSMRKENNRKTKGKLKGKGDLYENDENSKKKEEEDDDDDDEEEEEEKEEKENTVKLSHYDSKIDETSD